MCGRKYWLVLWLLPFCFSAGSLSAQEPVVLTPCEKTMQELRQIIPAVRQHCRTLELQLADCQTNLSALQVSLAISSANVTALQNLLDDYKQKLAALETMQAISAVELTQLQAALGQSEAALSSLKGSLESYRRKAEGTIKALTAWAWAGPVAGAAVVGLVWYLVSTIK